MGTGEVLAPTATASPCRRRDYERLVPWEVQLTNSLAELVQEHLDENGWRTIGDIEVYLARDDALHTGVFGVASRMESNAPPRRRPYDSLSLPAVPGLPPRRYSPAVPAACRRAAADARPGPGRPTPYGQPPGTGSPDRRSAPGARRASRAPSAAPAAAPAPAAVVVDGTNRRFDLQCGATVIGRGTTPTCSCSTRASPAATPRSQSTAKLRDRLRPGTPPTAPRVNGHEVASHVLLHGDVIRIGHTRLVFQQEQV